jgi:hypothetical protein
MASKGYAVQTISSLPFGMLIGAPLTAAVQAQSQAAKATIDFIMDVCFLPAAPGKDALAPTDGSPPAPEADVGAARLVKFSYKTTAVDPADPTKTITKDAIITVPLLSVVPIPFFQIDEMTIDFVAKITEAVTSSLGDKTTAVKEASAHAEGGWGPVSAGFKGSLSSTHSSTSEKSSKYQTELTMNIHVRASSESMPKGMGRVLDMLAGLIKQS